LEHTQVQLDHTQTSPTTAPSTKVDTIQTPSMAEPSSRSHNPIPTNISPEIVTVDSGGPQGELKVEMEPMVETKLCNVDISCDPLQVTLEENHEIQSMSIEDEYSGPLNASSWHPSESQSLPVGEHSRSIPNNVPYILNAHEYEGSHWEDFDCDFRNFPSQSEIRNNNKEDDLPETDADRRFRQVLESVKANTFELRSTKARRLYKAAIVEEDMNNPIALKIRVSIVNAINRSIKEENNPQRFAFPNPSIINLTRVEDQYSNFHRHSDSWVKLSDEVENILTDYEYGRLFHAVGTKMKHCANDQNYNLRGPEMIDFVNDATVCGLLEWYVKHDLITLIISGEYRLIGREIARKLLVHIRPSVAGRLTIYQGVQMLWCMWKFTSTKEEMVSFWLACTFFNASNASKFGDSEVIMIMLSQFSFFRNFVWWIIGTCWLLFKLAVIICLFGALMINLFVYRVVGASR